MPAAAGISRVVSGDPSRVTPVGLARGRGLGTRVARWGGRPGHRLGAGVPVTGWGLPGCVGVRYVRGTGWALRESEVVGH